MKVSHRFAPDSAVFDDDNLVSCAGLVPVMTLAERTGLVELLAEKVHIAEPKVKSGAANPAAKLATLVAGMCAGADSIDDIDVVRSGGMTTLFGGVYAPSTIGTLLREFSFGHARQLESVLRAHLARLCRHVDVLPGAQVRAFVDIDSLLRPTYGHDKQGASYGHTKIAGKQVLRKGLSPLATTISTDLAAPVITGMRLRAGRAGSGKGAARMVAQAIATARAAGATGQILVRGDSAYGTGAVVNACRRAGAGFSLVVTKNTTVRAAIAAIEDSTWTPVRYPGAVRDPDTGDWISDAEVAEIPYTAFASTDTPVTARLIVRRVKDARYRDALFPVWRYHPFFTDSTEPAPDADENVFDEQAQDALAFGDGRCGGLAARPGEEVFEVVGELEVDLPVGELAVERVDLVVQAGLAGAQLGHAGAELVEGDQLLLVGADEPGDRRGGLGQSGIETLALGGGRVDGRTCSSRLLISLRIRAGSASRAVMWFQTTVSR